MLGKMRISYWAMAMLQIIQLDIQLMDAYQKSTVNLHQGAIIHNKGRVMLGKHALNIYFPIQLNHYDIIIREYLRFLKESPHKLHLQLLALRIMNSRIKEKKPLNVTISDKSGKSSLKLVGESPYRTLYPILKLVGSGKTLRNEYQKKMEEKWKKAKDQQKTEWTRKINCLENKEKWLAENWKRISESTNIKEKSTAIPRCFQMDKKTKNISIITSHEATLEEISITLLKKLKHIEVKYNSLNQVYGPRKSKKKRGLINVVGDMEKYLFGTATSDDVKRIEKLVMKMKDGNAKVLHAVGSLEVVVEKEVERSEFLMNQTKLLNRQMLHLTTDIMKITKSVKQIQQDLRIEQVIQSFMQLLHQIALGLDTLEKDISQFLQDLDKAKANLLSSTLIAPEELRNITRAVCKKLPPGKLCNFENTETGYLTLYQETKTKILALPDGAKCVRLQVAINDISSTMQLWKITKIPIPMQQDGEQYIQLTLNENTLYGVNTKLGVEIPESVFDKCETFHNTPPQCGQTTYKVVARKTLDCIKNLESRATQCQTEVIRINNPALFSRISDGMGIYNFKKKKTISLICDEETGRETKYISLYGYGQLTYRADCDLLVEDRIYIGQHNHNSTTRFALKGQPFEKQDIPFDQLPQLTIWSSIKDDTIFQSADDVRQVQKAAEKALGVIDHEELEFEPVKRMLEQTKILLKEATKEQGGKPWYEVMTYIDWSIVIIFSLFSILAGVFVARKLANRKNKDVTKIVSRFRRTLEKHLSEPKRRYRPTTEATEAEMAELSHTTSTQTGVHYPDLNM